MTTLVVQYALRVARTRAYVNYPGQPRDDEGKFSESFQGSTEAVKDLVDMVDEIERTNLEPRMRLGGQSGETLLFVLPDGRRIVRKRAADWGDPDEPKRSADAEQLAGAMAAVLDVRTARVYRADRETVYIEHLPGETTGSADLKGRHIDELPGDPVAITRLGLLDALSMNGDRHAGNMIEHEGGTAGIDQGAAWALMDDDTPTLMSVGVIGDARPIYRFAEGNFGWRDSVPLTPSDVDETRRRLELLRPEFKRVGREAWLDRSLSILNDELAPRAKGTVSVYG